MKAPSRLFLIAALPLAVGASRLHAQLVVDGTTNTLSNQTNSNPGDVTVGSLASFSLLVISNNALLVNALNGVIGLNATSKSNEVRLLSPTSRWQISGSLFGGSNGAFNSLVVSNGALVEDFNGTLAFRAASSNNSVLVTGGGSLWTNRNEMTIGNLGAGNQLTVSNGGLVTDKYGYIGRSVSASNNFVLVSGSGSTWSNQFDFTVGFAGRSNRLVIEAGALVTCDNGLIGDLGGSNGGALVTGSGSIWSNRTRLVVGNNSTVGHRLTVSDGGVAWCGGPSGAALGGTGGTNNLVLITGASSLWTNQGDWNAGGSGNTVDVNTGGWLANVNGYMVGSNRVMLSGSGSGWNNSGDLQIGYFGDGSALIASDGATVLSSNALIGASTSLGNNNLALLTGAGTLWSNRARLTVGNFSFGNQFVVSNAALYVGTGAAIGANASASSNSAIVTGAQTRWTNSSVFYVGSNGPANHLTISNGGLLKSFGGYLGGGASSTNNEAVVTGPGSVWIPSSLLIGSLGDFGYGGNRLVISDGGSVISRFTDIGDNTSNNEVVVAGPGSVWTETDRVFLGYGQGRNRLVLTNGGGFFSQGIIVGGDTALSTNNRVIVDGGTLQVTNGTLPTTTLGAGVLEIRHGTNLLNAGLIDVDQLTLTNAQGFFEFNGGTLVTRGAVISNGLPFIVGASGTNPAMWDARAGVTNYLLADAIYIGSNSSFNQFFVTNGAAVASARHGILGYYDGANSNRVTVAGPGSTWSSGLDLLVGRLSSGNEVTVSNGATLFSGRDGIIGVNGMASDGNRVTVTGAGSLWTNAEYIWVGLVGTGNRLDVSDGGVVRSLYGEICDYFTSSSNVAQITGSGSLWSNATTLAVGLNGHQASLVVSNGGTVVAPDGITVGVTSASSNNRVVVDGGLLRATNAAGTGLLDVRRGAVTLASGLVEVDRLQATNALGSLVVNGGTLSTRSSLLLNGNFMNVGNNVGAATLLLAGNGVHAFGAVEIFQNSRMVGNGTVGGAVVVDAGGTVSPGTSIGKVIFTNSPFLFGTMLMELSKNGATLTNDELQVTASLRYRGTLTVTNLGPTAPANGDKFKLFTATSFSGAFDAISLPPLAPGLGWTNKLLVDGSIEVIIVHSNRFWTNVLGGSYQVPANWLDNVLPLPPDDVYFTSNATYQVSWAADAFAANAYFNASSGVVTQDLGTAAWTLTNSYIVGRDAAATAAVTQVTGSLFVTNSAGTAIFKVGEAGRATFTLNGGNVVADSVLVTNDPSSRLAFNGGTLSARSSKISSGTLLNIGDGVSSATMTLAGNGTHDFSGNLLVIISSNAVLTGNGTLLGGISILSGGTLIPGSSIGKMIFSSSLALHGSVVMELAKSGVTVTNDQLQLAGTLTYGGSLVVTHLGPAALAHGDKFPLFNAEAYAGSFSSISLPPLPPTWTWMTNLLVDGSIEVVAPPAIPIGSIGSGGYAQNFNSLATNGSANLWRDNSTIPGWYAAQSASSSKVTTYRASTGFDNNGELYSFGPVGSSERALGSIASDSAGTFSYGLCFSNDTFSSVSNFVVTYTGEQWRCGGTGSITNTLTFWYKTSPSAITNPEPGVVANWTQVTNLTFLSPQVFATTTALDGNQATNRQTFSAVLIPGLVLAPGQNLFFRWHDLNESGADQGMALDDLIIGFVSLPPQITSVSLNSTNGFLQISGLGASKVTYAIEAASNLIAPILWQRIGTNTADGAGLFQFTDTNAPSFPLRFYRALSP